MTGTQLDERSQGILKSLVQTYIATGQPVASAMLARRLEQTASSATVRNVMARLERLGYLEQPHTSAGRVPTDAGLRFFVEQLMSQPPLSPRDAAAIESGLASDCGSCVEVMTRASHLLSELSGNVGFALAPDAAHSRLHHIDFVRLPHPRVLVVMVSRAGMVTHRVVEIDEDISQEQLQACANHLNARYAGMDMRSIRALVLEQMREDKARYDSLLERLLRAADGAFAPGIEGSVYLEGTAHLLDRSEHADIERLRAVFHTFEERTRLLRILNACVKTQGVRVLIGCETIDPDLKGVTLVTAGYGLDGAAGWGLGIMGPTRMEYPRVVALVNGVASRAQRLLAGLNP